MKRRGKEERRSRKLRFLLHFLNLGAPVPTPIPISVKFGMQVRANGVLFCAKFHRDQYILYHAKMTDVGNFGGSCTHTPTPIRTKFGMFDETHSLRLCADFHLDRFVL